MAHQQRTARRAFRDLVPVTLATGAAGLVVTLLVGGTTAGIQSALAPGVERLPGLAVEDFAGGDPAAVASRVVGAVRVRVRPSRPAPVEVGSLLELAAVPEAPRGAGLRSPIELAVVRGTASRAVPAAPVPTGTAAPIAVTAPAVDVAVAPPASAITASTRTNGAGKVRTKPSATKGRSGDDGVVSLAAGTLTAYGDAPSPGSTTRDEPRERGDHGDRGDHGHDGPPEHASAWGRRSR